MLLFWIDTKHFTVFNVYMALTMTDLDEIGKVVDERIEEKIRNLPTKDEFFGKMDEVVGELKAIR